MMLRGNNQNVAYHDGFDQRFSYDAGDRLASSTLSPSASITERMRLQISTV